MPRVTKYIALLAGGAAALLIVAPNANAQSDSTHYWRFALTPYLWLAALDGKVGIGPVASNVDLGVGDILDLLKFGVMGNIEARKDNWVVLADGIYANLGAGHTIAFRGDTGSLDLSQSEAIIQPTAGYTVGRHTWAFDLLGGFRYWRLSASLDHRLSDGSVRNRSRDRAWVDATGGFRFHWMPIREIRFVAAADGGGGGSRSTWQWYSSLGVEPWPQWTLGVAYRWLSVDYDNDNFLYDTDMKGFVFGATYRFK